MASTKATAAPLRLIVSSDKNPAVTLKKGMRLDVREVVFNTPELQTLPQASRLCGLGGACLAIVHLGAEVGHPPHNLEGKGPGH